MNQKELDELRCGDTVQCKKHPKKKGVAVVLMEGDSIEEKSTACGCPIKNYEIIKRMKIEQTRVE